MSEAPAVQTERPMVCSNRPFLTFRQIFEGVRLTPERVWSGGPYQFLSMLCCSVDGNCVTHGLVIPLACGGGMVIVLPRVLPRTGLVHGVDVIDAPLLPSPLLC